MTRLELEQELLQLRRVCRSINPDYRMKDLTPQEIANHMDGLMRFVSASQTSDTIGSIVLVFGESGFAQSGGTIDRSFVPSVLRAFATQIESSSPNHRFKQELN